MIRDFSSGDVPDLNAVDAFDITYGDREPQRGGISIWQANSDTHVNWNAFNAFHDMELTDFTTDPFNQIRGYDDDHSASMGMAGRIAAGRSPTGTIEVNQDQDWFRITFKEGETYTIDLRGQASGSGSLRDPNLVLLDAEGDHVSDDWSNLDSKLIHTASETRTYFIAARELGDQVGTYELSAGAGENPTEAEPLIML